MVNIVTDTLRTRIARAADEVNLAVPKGLSEPSELGLAVADAVIAELGLRPQRHELLTRYITNWTHAENTK